MELAESWMLPPATGTAPGPAELPVPPTGSHPLPRAVPATLCATEPQGCCCCSTAPKRAPGGAEERAEAQGGPPAPPRSLCSPRAHLGVGDLGGFLGQAAALGGDQVVVFGHILVRVVQAAGAGPGWGPGGRAGGCSACVPPLLRPGPLGDKPRASTGSGIAPKQCQPPPQKNPNPREWSLGRSESPLGVQALPIP